jgi:DNA-binding response OmpR family regulator
MNQIDTQLIMNKKPYISMPVYNWRNKNILIVEDDYAAYLFFHEILSCTQACLIRAVSLQEAFDMLNADISFNLMIINTSIPGNEDCRSIKRIKLLWPDLRIIAVSGCECKGRNMECHPSGCDTMIGSVVDGNDMRVVVNEMFNPVN